MTVPGATGTSTPVVAPQGGELFRGFGALGSRVNIIIYIIHISKTNSFPSKAY